MFLQYNPSAGPAGALRRSPDNVHTTSLLMIYFRSYRHFYIFPMQDSHNYLRQITVNMSEDVVKDIIREAIDSNWDFLTELEMWTHYDNALSCQEDVALDEKFFNMLRTHEASSHASPPLSSGFPTPGPDISHSRSLLPLDDHIDFVPTFYHIVEFSTFMVEQAKYIYSLKFGKSLAHNKPKIPVSLSYNEIFDSKYIAEITAKAMLNPSELILQSSPQNLISPVSVPWDSQEYISKIRPKNTGKNLDFEEDLRARFPLGLAFPQLRGRETEFDTPMIIMDLAGHILCWYLPDIIPLNAQVLPHYF